MKAPQIISIIILLGIVGFLLSLTQFNAGNITLHIQATYLIFSYQQFFAFLFAAIAIFLFLIFVFRSAKRKKEK